MVITDKFRNEHFDEFIKRYAAVKRLRFFSPFHILYVLQNCLFIFLQDNQHKNSSLTTVRESENLFLVVPDHQYFVPHYSEKLKQYRYGRGFFLILTTKRLPESIPTAALSYFYIKFNLLRIQSRQFSSRRFHRCDLRCRLLLSGEIQHIR